MEAYGVHMARKLLCQSVFSRGAGCRYSYAYYREAGRTVTEPAEGDQIFFVQNGTICHTGLVTGVDEAYVYTVEGNTSDASGQRRLRGKEAVFAHRPRHRRLRKTGLCSGSGTGLT